MSCCFSLRCVEPSGSETVSTIPPFTTDHLSRPSNLTHWDVFNLIEITPSSLITLSFSSILYSAKQTEEQQMPTYVFFSSDMTLGPHPNTDLIRIKNTLLIPREIL